MNRFHAARSTSLLIGPVCLALMVACGGSGPLGGPSDRGTPMSPTSGAASATASSAAPENTTTPNRTEAHGTVTGLSGTCPSLSFTLGSTMVVTNAGTMFEGYACGEIANGDVGGAVGTPQTSGGLVANRVWTASRNPEPPSGKVSVAGTVSNLTGTCPSLSFSLGDRTVQTNAATKFDGGTCADVASLVQAVARGTLQSNGSLLADDVVLIRHHAPPTAGNSAFGTVAQLAGTCPAISFSVAARAIVTNQSTTFEGRPCDQLADGDHAGAEGTTQSDGSLLAARIFSGPR
jgi:hypothetical protein